MHTIRIDTASCYNVNIGSGLLCDAGRRTRNVLPSVRTILLVTDDHVDALYGQMAAGSFLGAGFNVIKHVLQHGETSKNFNTLSDLLESMAQAAITRADAIAALGGGVVGDISGFAASIYMRGIAYLQLPTTVLAAADSSVGGKTAIDLAAGKNLAGSFWQPSLVICDTDTFSTLPAAQWQNGAAECLKAGIICDEALAREIASGALMADAQRIIAKCVEIKANIVNGDEHDFGKRQLLNYGHTLGHAIERLSGYTTPHGHAVSVGMSIIARAAAKLGVCDKTCADDICGMISALGLPTTTAYAQNELFIAARGDKKRMGDDISLIVPEAVGVCSRITIPVSDLRKWIKAGWDI